MATSILSDILLLNANVTQYVGTLMAHTSSFRLYDPHCNDINGCTPLHTTSIVCHLSIVKYILDN